jgi:hypothetical protein
MNPRQITEQIEREQILIKGTGERFSGFAIMGVSFSSGYVLAMRRFPKSSLGKGYTSVWLRDPIGKWAFYQDRPPEFACSRYYGKVLSRIVQNKIEIDWIGSRILLVRVPSEELNWKIILEETTATRAINKMAQWIPDWLWQKESFMKAMGKVASIILKTGKLALAGKVPNGQNFLSNPKLIWLISESEAVLKGENLGNVQPLPEQIKIGEFWIPQRGLFAIGDAIMESYNPLRHQPAQVNNAPEWRIVRFHNVK